MAVRSRLWSVGALLLSLSLVVAACTDDDAETTTSAAPTPETTAPPTTVPEVVVTEPAVEVPFLAAWEGSGHNAAETDAFRHWDEEDPPVVPTYCATCHVGTGFLDFIGADGSAAGVVDVEHDPTTTISCTTCHNETALALDSVVMPSGAVLTGLGGEARCMTCHQGRASASTVDEAISDAGLAGTVENWRFDEVSEDLEFVNIHYYAAAATRYGTEAQGGYEYPGTTYDAFFTHVEGYVSCVDCHDPHSLEVKVAECSTCHAGVETAEDLRNLRAIGSLVDFDGDGDMAEGIYYEIQGAAETLLAAIQAYAEEVIGTGVVYDSHAYPYFFIDTDGDGVVGEGEAAYPNKYATWTPRLLKAAYNYQVSQKDPGGYAHGGKYILQLLYDSTADLSAALSTPVAVDAAHRIDHGHFAGSEEAFRHWDEDDPAVVSGQCSKCHTAEGLPLFLAEGVAITQAPSNGLLCSTCHDDLSAWTRFEAASVEFPSGAVLSTDDLDANLCMNCHQGRSSTASVAAAIAGLDPDAVSADLRFINIHYFAAGATLFGDEAMGGYQYSGNEYVGRTVHVEAFDTCTECHGAHTLDVRVESCAACHGDAPLTAIRITEGDFDGDGDASEGIHGEIDTMRDLLLTQIQAYAASIEGADPIIYDSHEYPYFFIDSDGDGAVSPGEGIYPNRYVTWTPRLLAATYNYQYAQKDTGGYAHGPMYVLQLLYDSFQDLGGDTTGMIRP